MGISGALLPPWVVGRVAVGPGREVGYRQFPALLADRSRRGVTRMSLWWRTRGFGAITRSWKASPAFGGAGARTHHRHARRVERYRRVSLSSSISGATRRQQRSHSCSSFVSGSQLTRRRHETHRHGNCFSREPLSNVIASSERDHRRPYWPRSSVLNRPRRADLKELLVARKKLPRGAKNACLHPSNQVDAFEPS